MPSEDQIISTKLIYEILCTRLSKNPIWKDSLKELFKLATIDPDFRDKLEVTSTHEEYGYKIWGEFSPPEKLSIHGDRVAVDFDICIADGACVDVCPEDVFEWLEYEGHAASTKKAAPAREDDCIECLACEDDCPVVAIKIYPM